MRAGQVKRLLTDSLTLKTVTGVDEYGQPTTTSSIIAGRIVRKHVRSRDENGEDFTSTTQVQTLTSVSVGDLLTIDGTDRRVRSVQAAAGTRGGATIVEAML